MCVSMQELYRRAQVERQRAMQGREFAAQWKAVDDERRLKDAHAIGGIALPRVFLIRDWVTLDEHDSLVAAMTATARFNQLQGRKVCVLGGFPTLGSEMLPLALPYWMAPIQKRLVDGGVFSAEFNANHCLLNLYEAGEGVAAHNDGPLYEPRVAILSLESHCVFEFVPLDVEEPCVCSVFVPRRSLLVFDEKAYTSVRHRVPACTVDVIQPHCINADGFGVSVGDSLERGRRLSLTMRHVRSVKHSFQEATMSDEDMRELRVREAAFLRSISEK